MFGVFVPWQKGLDFFDALLLLPYAFLSLLFVAPAVIDSCFAGGHRISVDGLMRGIICGWLWGLGLLILGLITVNLTAIPGPVMLPARPLLLSALVLSLLGCVFVAAISAWVALRSRSATSGKQAMRILFLVVLCALLFVPRLLSRDSQEQLTLLLIPDRLARATLFVAPPLTLLDALVLAAVLKRGNRDTLAR